MLTRTLAPLSAAELAGVRGGDGSPLGDPTLAPVIERVARALWEAITSPPAPSNYYYCKTGLPG